MLYINNFNQSKWQNQIIETGEGYFSNDKKEQV